MDDTRPTTAALVDGALLPSGRAMVDVTAARGDGALETIGVWGGRPFMLDTHLQRLHRSLQVLAIPDIDSSVLREEVSRLTDLTVHDDAVVTIHCTGAGQRILTLGPIPPRRAPRHLSLQSAPWIQPIANGVAGGPKTMSYARYFAARRHAWIAGADDALLHGGGGSYILEAPTSAVVLVMNGIVCVPDRSLGIVDSISTEALRSVATRLGLSVVEGRWPVEVVPEAEEIMLTSSLRDVVAVERVDDWYLPERHPIADSLAEGLRAERSRQRDCCD